MTGVFQKGAIEMWRFVRAIWVLCHAHYNMALATLREDLDVAHYGGVSDPKFLVAASDPDLGLARNLSWDDVDDDRSFAKRQHDAIMEFVHSDEQYMESLLASFSGDDHYGGASSVSHVRRAAASPRATVPPPQDLDSEEEDAQQSWTPSEAVKRDAVLGLHGAQPLGPMPKSQILDRSGLYVHQSQLGIQHGLAVKVCNAAFKLRGWLLDVANEDRPHRQEDPRAVLTQTVDDACEYTLTLRKDLCIGADVMIASGSTYITLTQGFSKCSCMKKKGIVRLRDQQQLICGCKVQSTLTWTTQ